MPLPCMPAQFPRIMTGELASRAVDGGAGPRRLQGARPRLTGAGAMLSLARALQAPQCLSIVGCRLCTLSIGVWRRQNFQRVRTRVKNILTAERYAMRYSSPPPQLILGAPDRGRLLRRHALPLSKFKK